MECDKKVDYGATVISLDEELSKKDTKTEQNVTESESDSDQNEQCQPLLQNGTVSYLHQRISLDAFISCAQFKSLFAIFKV